MRDFVYLKSERSKVKTHVEVVYRGKQERASRITIAIIISLIAVGDTMLWEREFMEGVGNRPCICA